MNFATLAADRRANVTATYKHMEGNNDHFYNIQHAVAVENDFNERQRVAEKLRLGAVPAHVTHRVVDALVARAQGIAAVNMEADRQAKIKAAAEAVEVATKEAAARAAKAAAKAAADEKKNAASSGSSSSGSSESGADLYYPSSIKHEAYVKKSSMPFESVVKKALNDGEQQVRLTHNLADLFPGAVKSGNAKLRALYE